MLLIIGPTHFIRYMHANHTTAFILLDVWIFYLLLKVSRRRHAAILIERRGKVVVSTSVWHAAGRWFDSQTRHVSLIGVKTWLSTGIVYLWWPIENHDSNVTWLPSRNKASFFTDRPYLAFSSKDAFVHSLMLSMYCPLLIFHDIIPIMHVLRD